MDETPDNPALPPQYSTGNLGFFTRVTEVVPTAVTEGPDGALYIAELTGIPYPDGYARVLRVGDPDAVVGFDGKTPSGVPQVYASGFDEIHSVAFDADSNLYVLEYVNANEIYDPTIAPEDLPPSRLIKVAPDGTRAVISGDELKLGNYVLVDPETKDVFVSINNTTSTNGQVLRYSKDAATGEYGHTVVADNLESPRGLAFGPDGNLYVLEQGVGIQPGSPGYEDAPVLQLIPGIVGQRGGYTGAITRVDLDSDGGHERVFTGLPSFQEFNPTTGEDRVLGVGVRGMAIAPDGSVFIASGGGLSEQSAALAGDVGNDLRGVLRLDGLFDGNPSDATWTKLFDSVDYAGENGPDGATTAFNTQSNLNDITFGPNGNLFAVDAARNVMYGLGTDGLEVESATVLQKRPPVLTPPQFAAVVEAGGNPTADYRVEISERTFKGPNGLPDTPGRAAVYENTDGDPNGGEPMTPPPVTPIPPPRGEDGMAGGNQPPGPGGPTIPAPGQGDPNIPGPIDPLAPPVLADNPYAKYFDPFFGTYAPAPSDPLILPAGERGSYAAATVYSFGDRLAENGGQFGVAAVAESLGVQTPFTAAPYSEKGNFTDGLNWTTYLTRILGTPETDQDTNFAYLNATARTIENPLDPLQSQTDLTNFAGQIKTFEQNYGSFTATDLVTVTFGGNDLTLPSNVSPDEGVKLSVQAIIDGLDRLVDLGAKHFLVTNAPDVDLAPIFSDPEFQQALGVGPGFFGPLVESFNDQLSDALDAFEKDAHVDVKELDLNTLFDAIVANPIAYGFTNVDEPVLINPPVPGSTPIYNPAIVGQDPLVEHGTLFLDPFFHPTALGHSVIAETARNALLDLPEGMDGSGKELFMTFVSESSPADSAIGYYFYDLPGDGKLAAGATVDGGIGEGFIAFTSTETTPAGTEVRIEVADGAGVAPFLLKNVGDVDLDLSAFKNGGLTFSQAGGEASVFSPTAPTVLADGIVTDLRPLHALDGNPTDTVNPLNPNGEIQAQYLNLGDGLQFVAFEDNQASQGYRDFNDAVVSLSPTSYQDSFIA